MTRFYMQVGPTTWRYVTLGEPPKRSDLPMPNVISDIMEPTEQVDGRFYTSKRAFRAGGRAHGLNEVGNEKQKPKQRATNDTAMKRKRRESIKVAIEKFKAGHRHI